MFSPAGICISHLKCSGWQEVTLWSHTVLKLPLSWRPPQTFISWKSPSGNTSNWPARYSSETRGFLVFFGRTKLKMLYMQFSGWVFCTERTRLMNKQISLVLNCWGHQIHVVSRTGHPRGGLWRRNVPQTHGQGLSAGLGLGCQSPGASTGERAVSAELCL